MLKLISDLGKRKWNEPTDLLSGKKQFLYRDQHTGKVRGLAKQK